jgi:hypothetical protein
MRLETRYFDLSTCSVHFTDEPSCDRPQMIGIAPEIVGYGMFAGSLMGEGN